jgi:hypothetical protein
MSAVELLELEVKEILKERRKSALRPGKPEIVPETCPAASAAYQRAMQSLYAEAFHRALRRLRFQS